MLEDLSTSLNYIMFLFFYFLTILSETAHKLGHRFGKLLCMRCSSGFIYVDVWILVDVLML